MSVLVGPFGCLMELSCPEPKANAPVGRASSELELLSGSITAQKAARSVRRWSLSFPSLTEDEFGLLLALEQGVYGTTLFMYDGFTARTNMLHPGVATPGLLYAWDECAADVTQQPGWVIGGKPVVSAAGFDGTLLVGRQVGGVPVPVPVIPGVTYTGSAHVDDDAELTLVWVDATGTAISTDAGSTDDERPYATAVAPTGAAGVVLSIDGTANATCFQLNEGPIRSWLAGQGVPMVHLAGVEQSLDVLLADSQFRSQSLPVVELALPRPTEA